MKKIELVVPKCPAWFIEINEEECSVEIPKLEQFLSPTQLGYFVRERHSFHSMRARVDEKYEPISKLESFVSYGNLDSPEWAESSRLQIFANVDFTHLRGAFSDEEGTELEGVEEKLFKAVGEAFYEANIECRKEFNNWKIKQQERIHSKWIETFANLINEK